MRHKNKINIKGFSFAETVVAVLILMLGVLFLVSLFPLSIKNLGRSKQITIATNLAQQKLEEYINNPASITTARGGFSNYPWFYYQINKKRVTWGTDLKQVTVRVFRVYNNTPAVDAVLSRIIFEKSGKFKIFPLYTTNVAAVRPGDGEVTIAELKTFAEEDGVYIITAWGRFQAGDLSNNEGRDKTTLTNKIYANNTTTPVYQYDKTFLIPPDVGAGSASGAVTNSEDFTTTVSLPKGSNTIYWKISTTTGWVQPKSNECKITAIFIPDSLTIYMEPIYVEPEEEK